MGAEHDLERDLRAALSESLGPTQGRFPVWGASPQSAHLLEPRSFRPTRRSALAAAAFIVCVVALVTVNVLGPSLPGFRPSPSAPDSSCAGCNANVIWAVAAFDADNVIAVGGTDDDRGSLVLLRSSDGGNTWAVTRPGAPALTSIARAGDRLYGSSYCLPQYPPDYALPSGAEVAYGPGVDRSFHPAPASCLYYSDDRGLTWHDTGAGRLVDPSFADAMNGWARAPYDALGKTATTLYSTTDGGRTWHAERSPCEVATPWIQRAVATGPGAGYVLCIGSSNLNAEPSQAADWELLRVNVGAAPVEVLGSGAADVPANTGAGGFFMRANGTGWVYTDTTGPALDTDGAYAWTAAIYRTGGGGQSWDRPRDATGDWPGVQSVSFVSATTGFAAFRSTGARSGVKATTDGGRSWHVLAEWDWWGSRPIPS